ncbi:alpha amylase [Hysterangium stoloniferum]|nr:alpha amylase [Hysterangium stoloniferum]
MSSSTSYAKPAFFKEALIYQIYPASFCDSNADGFGDLNGIRSKLDYLQSFGVDVVWLSPIYKSPLKDMGYDISDYKDIDPRYGTLEDWDALMHDLHARGMKIMMDLVVNHSSDQHEWFLSSRSSKTDPKRDWYIWRPPKYSPSGERLPPNNWGSMFGGSAWDWDEKTQEYYLHLYVPGQPDLNWENPQVRDAVWDVMLWWLKRGTDGFRMDVINLISKVPGLPDAEITDPEIPYQKGYKHFVNGPRVHEFLQEMHREVLSLYPAAITVGETPFTHDAAEVVKYVQPERKELNMVFQFEMADLGKCHLMTHDTHAHPSNALIPAPFKLPSLKRVVSKWQQYMYDNGGWNTLYLENHDLARSVSRWLGLKDPNDPLRARGVKLLAVLQTTQGGTLFVYQGQEIGHANVPIEWGIEEYKDVATQNFYKEVFDRRVKETNNLKPDMTDVMIGINKKARDNARTPVQWTAIQNAGFTSPNVEPWMRVNSDYLSWNAESQIADPKSVRSFWKDAIALRKAHKVLTYGNFELLSPEHETIFAYSRKMGSTVALVMLNFSKNEVRYTTKIVLDGEAKTAHRVLDNIDSDQVEGEIDLGNIEVTLAPWEARVYIA